MRLRGRSDDRSDHHLVADYAAILDGRTLWLAVPAGPDPLTLRHLTTGAVTALTPDDDDTDYCSVRHDLTTLPGAGEATYAVERAGASISAPEQIDGPTRAPTVQPDTFALEVAGDGALRITRSPGPVEALVTSITVAEDDTVLVRVAGPDAALRPDHVLLVKRGETLAEIEVVDSVATLSRDTTVDLPNGGCRLVVASGTTTWPLRRSRNDLVRPQSGVQLPSWGPAGGLELVWSASGDLRARPTGGGS